MIRAAFALLVVAVIGSQPVHARGSVADFARLQQACVEAGEVTFGANGRWPTCRVTARQWIATIGLLDFYQVQYCLGANGEGCRRQALLIFSNRAYDPAARLMLHRIDPEGMQYGDPLVVQNREGTVLVISAWMPGAAVTRQHYLWQADLWVAIDAKAWLRDLGQRLPDGTSPRAGVAPRAETMSARVPLYRRSDPDCCPSAGVADVELGLAKGRFTVKRVSVAAAGQ